MGKCGGVIDIIISILGVFIFPINSFTFILKTVRRFYLIKTDKIKEYSFVDKSDLKGNKSKLRLSVFGKIKMFLISLFCSMNLLRKL